MKSGLSLVGKQIWYGDNKIITLKYLFKNIAIFELEVLCAVLLIKVGWPWQRMY